MAHAPLPPQTPPLRYDDRREMTVYVGMHGLSPVSFATFTWYVAVGGGTAGCVLANRLSADSRRTVLLIEAGGVENAATDIPLFALLHFHGEYDWDYRTEPQQQGCLGMKDNRCDWARGKALGGSSVTNFQLYVRGNRRDFDLWEQRHGAKGWSYKDVLPYFKKFESYREPKADSAYRGLKGELPVTVAVTKTELQPAFLKAGEELGFKIVDYNAGEQTGFSPMQSTVLDGRRWSSAKSFIRPVFKERAKNLHISLLSTATKVKVVFDNKRAVAVTFVKDGKEKTVRARREVVLSAGTIGSTQLLLLSGVGPRSDLDRLGIYDGYFKPKRGSNAFHIAVVMNRLKSRGVIKLRSRNYEDAPILDPRYYTHPDDAKMAGEAIGQVVHLMKTKAFAALGTKPWDVHFPPCKMHSIWSNEYMQCMARHLSPTSWHQCCTNPMGSGNRAVVDPRLRVHGGITGLRIVDASVMPDIVTGNPNAAVYMIGEKGAAMILEDNK
ncbi:glucose dehydrogenase [FAD, quinone]-like [Dermacentor variabilis]|uniref:glucose dehydrogenase [FAD, quinone]-like n=1 Tax=Dermacentor variabilis TaxID=34621 RepID=UPI003F5AF598